MVLLDVTKEKLEGIMTEKELNEVTLVDGTTDGL